MYPFPLAEEVLTESPEVKDSSISIPENPGLRVEVNEEALKKYPTYPDLPRIMSLTHLCLYWKAT